MHTRWAGMDKGMCVRRVRYREAWAGTKRAEMDRGTFPKMGKMEVGMGHKMGGELWMQRHSR